MLNSSYNFLIDLILLSSIIAVIIIITMSQPHSHSSTEQSRQESCDIQQIDQDRRGRQQPQDREDETKGKAHSEVTESIEFVIFALKSY